MADAPNSKHADRPRQAPEREIDARPLALAVAVWLGVWLCTSRNEAAIAGCAVGALILGGWALQRRAWLGVGVALALAACLPCAALRVWVEDRGPLAGWAADGAMVTIEARVGPGRVGHSGFGGDWWLAPAQVTAADGRGERWQVNASIRLVASGRGMDAWRALPPGSLVSASVRLGPTDGGDATQAFARAREPPVVLEPPSLVDQVVEHLHEGLRASVSGMADGPRQLVPALVVGDTSTMDDSLRADFATTALTHLVAVSGSNLTILIGCALAVAVRLGARGWWLRGVAVIMVVFFVVLCRGEPSVLRAAAMGAIGLGALGWGKPGQGLRFLSWAVIGLLLVDPWLARSAGFALSVAATAGIVFWGGPWSRALGERIPAVLAEALCVPLAAQVATQPIVTAISGQVSLVGLVANMVAAPLVAPATILGFTATALASVSVPVASMPGTVAGWFAQGLCWIAQTGAQLPGATLSWSVDPVGLGLLGVMCFALVLVLPAVWARRWVAVAVVVGLVLAVTHPPSQPGWPPGQWQLVSCDVGQGDATVLNAGPGLAVVVDTGPDPAALDRCLSALGVRTVVLLVLTHMHADHVGGVAAVRQGRTLDTVLTSGVASPAANWATVMALTDGVRHELAVPGTTIQAGAVELEVVSVAAPVGLDLMAEGESSAENNASVVVRARIGPVTALLGGDVEEDGQRAAVATGRDLSADVFVLPHHGSAHQLKEYTDSSHALVALVSVGADNGYGHPTRSALRLVESAGMRVFRTDQNGAIAVSSGESGLTVTVQREPP